MTVGTGDRSLARNIEWRSKDVSLNPTDWKVITSFSWWAPVENPEVYITHRNEPTVE
jgi:hypothetical protein